MIVEEKKVNKIKEIINTLSISKIIEKFIQYLIISIKVLIHNLTNEEKLNVSNIYNYTELLETLYDSKLNTKKNEQVLSDFNKDLSDFDSFNGEEKTIEHYRNLENILSRGLDNENGFVPLHIVLSHTILAILSLQGISMININYLEECLKHNIQRFNSVIDTQSGGYKNPFYSEEKRKYNEQNSDNLDIYTSGLNSSEKINSLLRTNPNNLLNIFYGKK